ncbi:N-acetylglucosaminyldiphosphoundecaprenol N-acetyl-beta-D-mannosaminyltransferase [Paucidesulfovibrio gracilis DSM 16080]|uniref:N-acetylglucosaminyldiphosphoundecaprenol N-acetyl-beta-D-mannosaminyltransferase n=1 Tax=Paucidesulfovibrio gracilis DSM 16080 TaxID=1121449 RepID=A0A1T4XDT0_9BACT|nr:WecB/TagA/CpsF family glycosyltransferase [Paucidesulfovibrio gracilis]SKA87639.1 N-acetylglucosaminyldiphosphoundecaprenol N-acetyl-beta-D-mannosaminyltransferase [Paucidesulfovibrio gracilis DSM 16080]
MCSKPEESVSVPTVNLFGLPLANLDRVQTLELCRTWLRAPRTGKGARYVAPTNVDTTVQAGTNPQLLAAYQAADLVPADGNPVVWASRILGQALPERVTGSDLIPALFAAADPADSLRVFLLGAAPGVAVRAAERIHARYPGTRVVDVDSPPFGFHLDPAENERLVRKVNASGADLLILGLGAPKQEIWIHAHAPRLNVKLAVCAGATIDFLAGEQRRAPRWMRVLALEWLHRMLSQPRRLVRRYARDAVAFPAMILRERRRLRNGRSQTETEQ